MPSKTEKQRKLFAIALGIKKGKIPCNYSKEACKIANELSTKQIREFAEKVKKNTKRHKK